MVTVCYLSRNRPQYLANSLDTVRSQTTQPTKIVVIDCSDDVQPVEDVVNRFQDEQDVLCELQWRPMAELSRSQGRNLGRQYADTPIIISTECDILLPPTIIEQTLKMFGDLQQKIYVQPHIAYCGRNGVAIPNRTHKNHQTGFYQMFRTCDFDAIGGYNPFLAGWGYEDADFKSRLIRHGCKLTVAPLTVRHISHDASGSIKQRTTEHTRNEKMAQSTHWDGTTWRKK